MKKMTLILLVLIMIQTVRAQVPNEIKVSNPGTGNTCTIGFSGGIDGILVYTLDTTAYIGKPKLLFKTTFESGVTRMVHFIMSDTVKCTVKYLTRNEFDTFLQYVSKALEQYTGSFAFKKAEEDCFWSSLIEKTKT